MEEIAGVPRHQRSTLFLQPRPTDAILLLPGERSGADEMAGLAETFYKRGFTVLTSSLSFRNLDQPGHSPRYWQTCADEAENRYDILAHFSTRVVLLGVGMAALIALHVAATRRASHVLALLPALGSEEGWLERLRWTLRRLVLRDRRTPPGWTHQRRLAAQHARDAIHRLQVPLFVLAEDRSDRTEAGRSARITGKLVHRAATRVRVLRPGEAASVRDLPPAVVDELITFVRQT